MSIYFGSHTIIPIVVFGSNKIEGEGGNPRAPPDGVFHDFYSL